MQRFTWDLLYPNPPADGYDLPISAIYGDTPWTPQGPAVLPGVYTLKLTVEGTSYTQKLNVRIDPRVKTSSIGLRQQFALSIQAYEGIAKARTMTSEARRRIAEMEKSEPTNSALPKLKALVDGQQQRPGTAVDLSDLPLSRLSGAFTQLLDLLQDADVAPSKQAVSAARDLQAALVRSESDFKIEMARSQSLRAK